MVPKALWPPRSCPLLLTALLKERNGTKKRTSEERTPEGGGVEGA